ncbi:alpha/beta hydrolase [Pararhodospirillum photometricum]|uniref:Serine aminopeptidase S33 domain-containing protein n=1 Tax=Pararhodospirillum photometricum DSM 122 TaxID=1150469 RepID=H6SMT5_PARPM|nr:alpha/beta hydrolase [Pararhodospirillum photometricum]CCG09220.1 Putative uncharacterized protein [Pararhodospirillum photometricum DSM 122]
MTGAALILALAGAYGAVVAALALGQRRLQYRPGPGPIPDPATLGEPRLQVVARAAGPRLAWYAPPPPAGRVVVYFHGNAGTVVDRLERARFFLDAGLGVLLVEWPGFGGVPGRPSEPSVLAEARAAVAFLLAQGIAPASLVFYGESLGSGVAVRLAAEGPAPGGVILDGGFTSALAVAQKRYPWIPVALFMRDRFDNLAVVSRVRGPFLILHGGRDAIVPLAHAETMAQAVRGPVETYFPPSGGHVDLYDHGAGPVVLRFLRRWEAGLPSE